MDRIWPKSILKAPELAACEHPNFNITTSVVCITENGETRRNLSVSLQCSECGQEFEFEHLPPDLLGTHFGERNQREAKLPIRPVEHPAD